MLSDLDDRILALHQRVFDEVEYRYGFTTAQCTELALSGMFIILIVESYFADAVAFMGFVSVALLLSSYMLAHVDRHIRSNRRSHVEAVLHIRKGGVLLFLRFYILFSVVTNVVVFLILLKFSEGVNVVSGFLNLLGIYFSVCLDDVDGEKRKRMEREAAEAEMDAVKETF